MTDPLSPPEAAERLGVSAETVRRWVRSGKLVGDIHPITGRIDVDPRSVDTILATLDGAA